MTKAIIQDKLLEQVVENNWIAVTIASLEGEIYYTNKSADELYGYSRGELIGKNVDVFNGKLEHDTDEIINDIMTKGKWEGELVQVRKDQSTFLALLDVWLVNDKEGNPIALASNSKDISQAKQNEKELQKALDEKQFLLNEIHHRVKNNLAVISSLLKLEELNATTDEIKNVLISSQNRIKSTALVHEFMYQNDSIDKVAFKSYIEEYIKQIQSVYTVQKNVEVKVTGENYLLDITKATPCGLILNELFTNSMKHAFNGIEYNPLIEVSLTIDGGNVRIMYRDNGVGFDYDQLGSQTKGIAIVKTLTKQLKGEIDFVNDNGTQVSLVFDVL